MSTGELLAWLAASGTARAFAMLRAHLLLGRALGSWWTPGSVALALALGLARSSGAHMSGAVDDPLLALGIELALGGALGLWISLPVAGVAAAEALSPRGGGPAMGPMLASMSVALAVAAGLHHALFSAFAELCEQLPPGLPPGAEAGELAAGLSPASLARAAHAITALALALAAPWWLTRAVVQLAGAALGGAEPAFDATRRGYEGLLVASLGLLALFVSVESYPQVWGGALGSP